MAQGMEGHQASEHCRQLQDTLSRLEQEIREAVQEAVDRHGQVPPHPPPPSKPHTRTYK